MKRISICFIIPYYKIPLQLLARCIESVRNLGDRADWEIRVVDDGTPGNEAREFLRQMDDSRIHYHWQENGGQGAARNTGWELCEKEYIHFLDADDYLFRNTTLQAIELLEKEHPDLLAFDYIKVYENGTEEKPEVPIRVKYRGNGTDYMLHYNLHGWACGYFFRKEAAGKLRFTPGIYHEDEEFIPLLWLRIKNLIVTTLPVYAYYQRPDSTIHNADRQKIKKRYEDFLGIINRLKDKAVSLPSKQSRALRRRVDMLAMAMIYTLMIESPEEVFLENVLQQMKNDGFYPLPPSRWSLLYMTFRICTIRPCFVKLLSNAIFRGKKR